MVTNSKRARRAVRSGSRRMSDQERMQNRKRPADQKQDQKPAVKKEDAPASAGAAAVTAALALAVESAQQAAQPAEDLLAQGQTVRPKSSWRQTGVWAAGLAAAVGIGWFGGVGAVLSGRSSQTALAQWAEAN